MRTSAEINEIATALAKAQGEMRNPEKNRSARIPTKSGGSYSYDYADLPSTYDCVRAALSSNALSHTLSTEDVQEGVLCRCRLMHASGQWLESDLHIPASQDIKSIAASITYARRYLFSALVGIAGEDDVDSDPESSEAKYEHKNPKAQAPSQPLPVSKSSEWRPADAELKEITRITSERGWSGASLKDLISSRFKKGRLGLLNRAEYDEVVKVISSLSPEESEAEFFNTEAGSSTLFDGAGR